MVNYPFYCVDVGPLNCFAVVLLLGYTVALSNETVFITSYSRIEKRKTSTLFKRYKKWFCSVRKCRKCRSVSEWQSRTTCETLQLLRASGNWDNSGFDLAR